MSTNDKTTMDERADRFLAFKVKHMEDGLGEVGMAAAFAASEVALALAPREPSPELVEAECVLRAWSEVKFLDGRAKVCAVIASELDRLRAEVARKSRVLRGSMAVLETYAGEGCSTMRHLRWKESCLEHWPEDMGQWCGSCRAVAALAAARAEEKR
jgi:hypothetical protein